LQIAGSELNIQSCVLRYLLLLFSCIAFLNGCVTAPERTLADDPTFGDKDLQTLRYWYGKGRMADSEASASALRYYRADYRALVVAATNKDQQALASLMSFSLDGEAGEEHDVILGLLLTGLGDDFFSAVLKSQSRAVRKLVLGSLSMYGPGYIPEMRTRNPKTFGISER
jgi:hypothetical protein